MDRTRGVVVAVWASIVALVAGVGAGAYWGWWNAIQKQMFRESPSALPMVAMGAVAVVAALVALVIGLVLACDATAGVAAGGGVVTSGSCCPWNAEAERPVGALR